MCNVITIGICTIAVGGDSFNTIICDVPIIILLRIISTVLALILDIGTYNLSFSIIFWWFSHISYVNDPYTFTFNFRAWSGRSIGNSFTIITSLFWFLDVWRSLCGRKTFIYFQYWGRVVVTSWIYLLYFGQSKVEIVL